MVMLEQAGISGNLPLWPVVSLGSRPDGWALQTWNKAWLESSLKVPHLEESLTGLLTRASSIFLELCATGQSSENRGLAHPYCSQWLSSVL